MQLGVKPQPSPRTAELRGNVCGHCADITDFESLGRFSWRGSRRGSPTTATPGSSPATATPKADNAPQERSRPSGLRNAPPTARKPRSATAPGTTTPEDG